MGPVSTTQIADTGPRLVEIDPLQPPPPPPMAPQAEALPLSVVEPVGLPPVATGPAVAPQPPAEDWPATNVPLAPPEPLAAPPSPYPGFGLPPGYPPPGYPPMGYPGYHPQAYSYYGQPPFPGYPQPDASQPQRQPGPQDWAGQPYPYPPMPYPPMPYPPPYPTGYPAAFPAGYPPPMGVPQTPLQHTLQAQNQQLLITGIIAAVLLIHLPWLLYLYGVHGCFGTFLEVCRAVDPTLDLDTMDETPLLFARVAFFMLRVQTVLSVDFAKFSEVLQLSTGLGSFALTKIVAANGMVATGNLRRFALAATCAVAFVVLFWAELHLTGSTPYAVLGDETVLSYIDLELPADFLVATEAKAGLMQYLQILRLADAVIFGAALAMPRAVKGA